MSSSLKQIHPQARCRLHATSLNGRSSLPRSNLTQKSVCQGSAAEKYGWTFKQPAVPGQDNIEELAVKDIKRPLQGTRTNDADKVQALMESIQDIGLQEPIDVLFVEGKYYGFSGCHRYEACQRLGKEKILAKVRKANRKILKMHFM